MTRDDPQVRLAQQFRRSGRDVPVTRSVKAPAPDQPLGFELGEPARQESIGEPRDEVSDVAEPDGSCRCQHLQNDAAPPATEDLDRVVEVGTVPFVIHA